MPRSRRRRVRVPEKVDRQVEDKQVEDKQVEDKRAARIKARHARSALPRIKARTKVQTRGPRVAQARVVRRPLPPRSSASA